MSFTIEIPDALADRLRAEAEARGEDLNRYAVAKLAQPSPDAPEEAETEEAEADEDLITALREGIADGEAGRVLTLEEMNAQILESIRSRRHGVNGNGVNGK